MAERAHLRWEAMGTDGARGLSGRVRIALVGQFGADVCPADKSQFYWSVDLTGMKWIAKSYGEVRSLAQAKRSAERAWNTWLEVAGLAPEGQTDG